MGILDKCLSDVHCPLIFTFNTEKHKNTMANAQIVDKRNYSNTFLPGEIKHHKFKFKWNAENKRKFTNQLNELDVQIMKDCLVIANERPNARKYKFNL